MAQIVAKLITHDNDNRIVVLDEKGSVWVYNHTINPARWVKVTELPEQE